MLNNKKLDTFIFYSSELIHYKTIVKAKNEDDAYKKYDVNKKDEVYRNEYQIDSVEIVEANHFQTGEYVDSYEDVKEQLELIYNTLGEGQGLLELNDFEDYEERTEEFERGFEALVKVEAYIKELEEKIKQMGVTS